MARTDDQGNPLKAMLTDLLGCTVDTGDIIDALGISRSTYYRRVTAADYPNAEELRLIAHRFALNGVDLQVRFGLMSAEEVLAYYSWTQDRPAR